MSELQLGLCNEPTRTFLYVAQDESGSGSCWYWLDRTKNPPAKVFVPQRGVRGYISGLRIAHVTTQKHGDKEKLDIFMDCGEQAYAIRAGVDTTFARGVLLSLLAIKSPEVLKDVVTIVAAPSKENAKIVFGQVYITKSAERVKFVWDKDIDLRDPITYLQSVLGDGGTGHDDIEEDERPAERVSDMQHDAAIDQQRDEEADRHQRMVTELTRCGILAGLATVLPDQTTDLSELNRECARLYNGKKIDQLTRDEGIKFRATLMAL